MLTAPRRISVVGRLGLAIAAGLLVGTYTALELLPEQVPLQVGVVRRVDASIPLLVPHTSGAFL